MQADEESVIRAGELTMDQDTHEVLVGDVPDRALSPTEFKLLRYLMLNPNRVLSKAQILDHVWEYDFNGDAGIVESYISYLRRKLDPHSTEPLIQTKRGFGYMLKAAQDRLTAGFATPRRCRPGDEDRCGHPSGGAASSLRAKITGVTVADARPSGSLVAGIGTVALLRNDARSSRLDEQARGDRLDATSPKYLIDSRSTTADVGHRPRQARRPPPTTYFVAVYDARRASSSTTAGGDARGPSCPAAREPHAATVNARTPAATRLHAARRRRRDRRSAPVVGPHDGRSARQRTRRSSSRSRRPTPSGSLAVYLTIFLGFGLGVVHRRRALLTRMLVTLDVPPLARGGAHRRRDRRRRLRPAHRRTRRRTPRSAGSTARSTRCSTASTARSRERDAHHASRCAASSATPSHELRTPLVSVRGYAELYRMGALRRDDDVAQAMDRIEKEAIRMGGLVEDLLALARLDERRSRSCSPRSTSCRSRAMPRSTRRRRPRSRRHRDRHRRVGRADAASPAPEPRSSSRPPSRTGAIAFAGATLARSRPIARAAAAPTLSLLRRAGPRPGSPRERQAARRPRRRPATSRRVDLRRRDDRRRPRRPTVRADGARRGEQIRQVVTNLLGNALRFTSEDRPIEHPRRRSTTPPSGR